MSTFNVGHLAVWGHDHDGTNTNTPLVDVPRPDGTVTVGLLDRVQTITTDDILDAAGNSLYASGLIAGVHTSFLFGTKTQDSHENWYPAQPGHPACPVRLLLSWLKHYDRLLVAHRGRRLTADDPLFCSLKQPGEPIRYMSRTLGKIVKAAMSDIGCNPDNYSAHSLRKFRASYVLSQGGSMTDVMVHDGRSSEATGLVYAHRNPQHPFRGDPTIDIYNRIDQPEPAKEPAMPSTAKQNGSYTSPFLNRATHNGHRDHGISADIDTLRRCINNLRRAGLDDAAISAVAGPDSP